MTQETYKEQERRELQAAVDEYLAQGGKISKHSSDERSPEGTLDNPWKKSKKK